MAFQGKSISLVIPCFNEEQGLRAIFSRLPSYIDEVIVVDNGSTDGTAKVAQECGARLIFAEAKGYGNAYKRGLPEALGDIICMMDGDDTYPIEELDKLLNRITQEERDFVSGCRFPLKDKSVMPIYKRAANRVMVWLVRKCLRIQIVDTQTGMCVFRRDLLNSIMPSHNGMAFGQEIKFNAWFSPGIRSSEVHIWYRRRIGKVKYRPVYDGYNSLAGLLRYRRKLKETVGAA